MKLIKIHKYLRDILRYCENSEKKFKQIIKNRVKRPQN